MKDRSVYKMQKAGGRKKAPYLLKMKPLGGGRDRMAVFILGILFTANPSFSLSSVIEISKLRIVLCTSGLYAFL